MVQAYFFKNMKRTFFYLLICLMAFSACKQNKTQDSSLVFVTIEPLKYFANEIGGDKFKVETMVPKGGNPETYEPTAKQMMRLSQCPIFIKVGNIGFERTWNERLHQSAPNTMFIDSSEGISPIESSEHVDDPHTWMSCNNAIVIARHICNAFKQQKPADSTYFNQNLNRFIAKVNLTDQAIKGMLYKSNTKAFLIYHPTLTYFAHNYQLIQIPVEEEGREPSAAQLKQTIVFSKKNNAKIMFIQKEFANRNTQVVAEGAGVKQVDINPLSYQWHEEMMKIAKALQ